MSINAGLRRLGAPAQGPGRDLGEQRVVSLCVRDDEPHPLGLERLRKREHIEELTVRHFDEQQLPVIAD